MFTAFLSRYRQVSSGVPGLSRRRAEKLTVFLLCAVAFPVFFLPAALGADDDRDAGSSLLRDSSKPE